MKKKRTIILVTVALLVVSGIAAGYFQLFRPISVQTVYVTIQNTHKERLDWERARYEQLANGKSTSSGEQLLRIENPFPSDNPDDYCNVSIMPIMKSRSLLSTTVDEGILQNVPEDTPALYKSALVALTYVGRFQTKCSNDTYSLFCYRGDMTDEELIASLRALDLRVYYEVGFFHDLSMKLPLKNMKLISLEERTEIQRQYDI